MNFKNMYALAAFSLVLLTTACNQNNNRNFEANLDSQIDSVSYALGYQYGMFMSQQGLNELDVNAISAGINTGLSGEEGLLNDVQSQRVIQSYQQVKMQEQQEEMQMQGEENLKVGQDFLKENLTNDDVEETESGLQYKVLEEGDGDSPTAENVVRVHYEGRLINGEVFDSSYDRGEPAEFPLNGVISGWTEGVQLMKEGSKFEFYIPADLAYGANPRPGGPIGPNATLIFVVELLEVVE